MRTLRHFTILLLLTVLPLAQAQDAAALFPTTNYFHTIFQSRQHYKLELPGTLRDHVHDGKLVLSLADVTQLAVSRNTDVWLARLDVQQAETPVTRAFAPFDPQFNGSFNSSFSSSPPATRPNGPGRKDHETRCLKIVPDLPPRPASKRMRPCHCVMLASSISSTCFIWVSSDFARIAWKPGACANS